MTTVPTKTKVTPEELLNRDDAVDYELVDGYLVERNIGSESSAIALAIGAVLIQFVRARRLGHVFTTDCGYQCFPDDPGKIRKPDISFVSRGRLNPDRPPQGYILIPPDLAIEVLSPGDLAYEIDEKVAEYLRAGVRLIWVVNPHTRNVRIHRPDTSGVRPIDTLKESDTISGEDVLPEFECRVSEFFDI